MNIEFAQETDIENLESLCRKAYLKMNLKKQKIDLRRFQ
jgi:hypothetical protein